MTRLVQNGLLQAIRNEQDEGCVLNFFVDASGSVISRKMYKSGVDFIGLIGFWIGVGW